jgi:hypothetical protein
MHLGKSIKHAIHQATRTVHLASGSLLGAITQQPQFATVSAIDNLALQRKFQEQVLLLGRGSNAQKAVNDAIRAVLLDAR